MPDAYGYEVDEPRAIDTIDRVVESPIRFLDTSNEYSQGESERRIGAALRAHLRQRDDLVIATKADPLPGETHFTGARVRASFDESAERLGVAGFDVYYLHDPERFPFGEMTAPGGPLEALVELRDSGRVGAIGVAGGSIDEMRRYADTGLLDVVLNHNQFTLLDQSADGLIDDVLAVGAAFVNAAPYASGILAKSASSGARYQYGSPSPSIIVRMDAIRHLCAEAEVPVAAAALQFSTRNERISSTVVGVSMPQRVDELVANEERHIPDAFWRQLWELIDFEPKSFVSTGSES